MIRSIEVWQYVSQTRVQATHSSSSTPAATRGRGAWPLEPFNSLWGDPGGPITIRYHCAVLHANFVLQVEVGGERRLRSAPAMPELTGAGILVQGGSPVADKFIEELDSGVDFIA